MPGYNQAIGVLMLTQFEKVAGKPDLPADPDERREAFNAALTQLAKSLPATDPGVKTSTHFFTLRCLSKAQADVRFQETRISHRK